MSVHRAITEHSQQQYARVRAFYELDEKREQYIEEVVQKCLQNEPFSLEKVNKVTNEINQLAKQGIVPTRKIVTEEMVFEYVNRLREKNNEKSE